MHVDIYYEDLIDEAIKIINNIGYKFDLFISIYNKNLKIIVENYVKKYSLSNKIEIIIFPNKERKILPLIHQLKNNIKKYKYFCHIHTKKYSDINFGDEWRKYIYNNLLGNYEIISEIITEFENNKKLGLIFPEAFYKALDRFGKEKYDSKYGYMKFNIKNLSYLFRINLNDFYFPLENMLWAKVEAIYQVFELNKIKVFSKDNTYFNLILMQGFQIIFLYISKINGYYYKKIFKHL